MAMAEESMEILFGEKLELYRRLAALMKQEKLQVVGADVDALWEMSGKKKALADEIVELRGRMLKAADAMGINHGMTPGNFQTFRFLSLLPVQERRRLDGVEATLRGLKGEIREVSLESKRYIESKLGMIGELMTMMTGRDRRQGQNYGATSARAGYGGPMLIRRQI